MSPSKRVISGVMGIGLIVVSYPVFGAGASPEAAPGSPELQYVRSSARKIPVAFAVDVLVVGGGTGAVAAAVTAAEAGSSVFLASPYPYLGEDMTATYRLWLESGELPDSPLGKKLFGQAPPFYRPSALQVKRTLDKALMDAGVKFLFECFPSDIIRDPQGMVAGVVFANRAGRQAVLAKVVIDASERAVVARLAGAKFRQFQPGRHLFKRVVFGGDPVTAENVTSQIIAPPWGKEPHQCQIIEYQIEIEMKDDSFASFASVEQQARTMTYSSAQKITADCLFHVPTDPVHGRVAAACDGKHVNEMPIDVFRPADVERIYVLGGMADISRERAERLMRPLELISLGMRIGHQAAQEARQISAPDKAKVAVFNPARASSAPKQMAGELCELNYGVRPVGTPSFICEDACFLPVLAAFDVVVVGGGTSGSPAAIAAAREGAKVLVVEKLHLLGGMGTIGQNAGYYHGNRVGFTETVPGAGDKNWSGKHWPIEEKAEWWRRAILDAGGEVWFGATGCGAIRNEDRICGVIVATPQGRIVVSAKVVVDATGNADIAAHAGAATSYTGQGEFSIQGAGTTYRVFDGDGPGPSYTIVDETDMVDVWHALVWTKEKYSTTFDQAPLTITRERRRIVGDFVMTLADQIVRRTYPDTISQAKGEFDLHGYPTDPMCILATPIRPRRYLVNIPYRCLLAKGLDGLLTTGLGLSAHRDAIPIIRMQPDMQNLGYATGLAAAMSAQGNIPLRGIPAKDLQKKLVAIGNITPSVMDEKDSIPLSAAELAKVVRQHPPTGIWRNTFHDKAGEKNAAKRENVPEDEFRTMALIFLHREMALPILRQAYAETDGEKRLVYALILGVLGDPTGAATILEKVKSFKGWDVGWNYTNTVPAQGGALSQLDTCIIALGMARYQPAVPAICDLARKLDANSDFSHHRAVALALELVGDKEAAPTIAEMLSKPGTRGYVHDSVETVLKHNQDSIVQFGGGTTSETRRNSIRELLLARALYRLGDHDGLGLAILKAYTADLRGHLARHAQSSLQVAPDPIWAYSWKVVPADTERIVNFAWLWRDKTTPAELKSITDAQPVGHRTAFAWNFHEGISGSHPKDVCHNPDGTPTEHRGIWWDHSVAEVRERFDAFFAEYKRIGGQLDVSVLDHEDGLSMWRIGRGDKNWPHWQAIMNDPRFKAIAERLGFSDLKTVCYSDDSKNYLRWNALMKERVARYVNEAIYEPIAKHFPNVIMSNYDTYRYDWRFAVPDHNGNDQHRFGHGAHVGTHQSQALYTRIWNLKNRELDGKRKYVATPFNGFRRAVNQMRAMALSSDVPIQPWLSHKAYKGSLVRDHDLYQELILHIALSGADSVLLWNPWEKDQDSTFLSDEEQERLFSRCLARANELIGYEGRKPLFDDLVPWDASFVLTGMAANGRTVWRLTPEANADKAIPGPVITDTGIAFTLSDATITFVGGEIYLPENPVSNHGWWIIASEDARPVVKIRGGRE